MDANRVLALFQQQNAILSSLVDTVMVEAHTTAYTDLDDPDDPEDMAVFLGKHLTDFSERLSRNTLDDVFDRDGAVAALTEYLSVVQDHASVVEAALERLVQQP